MRGDAPARLVFHLVVLHVGLDEHATGSIAATCSCSFQRLLLDSTGWAADMLAGFIVCLPGPPLPRLCLRSLCLLLQRRQTSTSGAWRCSPTTRRHAGRCTLSAGLVAAAYLLPALARFCCFDSGSAPCSSLAGLQQLGAGAAGPVLPAPASRAPRLSASLALQVPAGHPPAP